MVKCSKILVLSRKIKAEVMMTDTIFVLFSLFATLQVVTGITFFGPFRDTSNYKILGDPRVVNNYTYYEAKCRGELNVQMPLHQVLIDKHSYSFSIYSSIKSHVFSFK